MQRGTPVRYMAVESCDQVRRKVFCRNYSWCLDFAIQKKWPSFSCQNCNSYQQELLARDQLRDEQANCMALAFVIGAVEKSSGSGLHV